MTGKASQTRPRGRLGRVLSVLAVVLAVASPAAVVAKPACTKSCKAPVAACTRCVATELRTARAACVGTRVARRACRNAAAADGKAQKARCRALAPACVACCKTGGTSCAVAADPPVCPIGRPVQFTPAPRRDPATLPLPVLPNGHLLVIEAPGGRLEVDPTLHDALTVLGRCTAWIAACVAPPDRTLDDCARSAPQCATATPWNETATCCPAACYPAYRHARIVAPAGEPPLDTFAHVYFDDAGCFPGVAAAVGR